MKFTLNLHVAPDTVVTVVIRRAFIIGTLSKEIDANLDRLVDPQLIAYWSWMKASMPEMSPEAESLFQETARRHEYLEANSDAIHGERLEFETEQLVLVCLEAWRLAPMETAWPKVEKLMADIPDKKLEFGLS